MKIYYSENMKFIFILSSIVTIINAILFYSFSIVYILLSCIFLFSIFLLFLVIDVLDIKRLVIIGIIAVASTLLYIAINTEPTDEHARFMTGIVYNSARFLVFYGSIYILISDFVKNKINIAILVLFVLFILNILNQSK